MGKNKGTQKKRKKWLKFRHKVIRSIVFPFLYLITKLKYHVDLDRINRKDTRQYLILSNHQTGFDQFFISICFPQPVYYVATEDIFSTGWVAKLLSWGFAPIPFKKSTNDVASVMTTMRVAHEGGTIGIFPEGNRTYHGKTVNIKDSIAVMAKKMRLPIALFRIEGGYGIQPRWSDIRRKGRMKAGVIRVIEPEEAAAMSNDELYSAIVSGLYIDEYQIKDEYHSSRLAEHIERAIYVCPECGLSEFKSNGCFFICSGCGGKTEYLPNKTLRATGFKLPFNNEGEWYEYQENFIRRLDMTEYIDRPAYTDKVSFMRVIPYKKKALIDGNAEISLFGDRYEITVNAEAGDISAGDEALRLSTESDGRKKITVSFKDITASTAVGKNKVNFYTAKGIYQFKAGADFNGLKYVNFYYHGTSGDGNKCESSPEGSIGRTDGNSEFLGL